MTGPTIVLDCDPGIDDAFAIFCALRYTDVVAVTTVSGNVGIDDTTRNARHLLGVAGADTIPVHRGAAEPLVAAARFADVVHGRRGLGDLDVPDPTIAEAEGSAEEAILARFEQGPVTVVATGPLTNIARALRLEPAIAQSLELYWMGGSTVDGNVEPQAEFNCWVDPHALDEVLAAGVPITMFGLNLTRQVRMGRSHRDRLAACAAPTARIAAQLLAYYESHGVQDGRGQPMHDPCALLGLTHPHLFTFEAAHLVVTTDGTERGRTTVTAEPDGSTTPITLVTAADAAAVIELILDAAENPHPE